MAAVCAGLEMRYRSANCVHAWISDKKPLRNKKKPNKQRKYKYLYSNCTPYTFNSTHSVACRTINVLRHVWWRPRRLNSSNTRSAIIIYLFACARQVCVDCEKDQYSAIHRRLQSSHKFIISIFYRCVDGFSWIYMYNSHTSNFNCLLIWLDWNERSYVWVV